jgi:hypothetical protein
MAPGRAEKLEEHLLACPECQSTLHRVDDFVSMMRSAAPDILKGEKRPVRFSDWFPRARISIPVAVFFVLLSIAVGLAWRADHPSGPVAYVTLVALRGSDAVTAPVGRPLELDITPPDAAGASNDRPAYSAEVLSGDGRVSWAGSAILEPAKPLRFSLPKGLAKGAYWARLYGADHALILEAGFKVE